MQFQACFTVLHISSLSNAKTGTLLETYRVLHIRNFYFLYKCCSQRWHAWSEIKSCSMKQKSKFCIVFTRRDYSYNHSYGYLHRFELHTLIVDIRSMHSLQNTIYLLSQIHWRWFQYIAKTTLPPKIFEKPQQVLKSHF